MAKNAAVVIMMIFTMLIPLRLDTRTVDRVTPQFAPASSSRAVSSFAEHAAARYNILNKGLTSISTKSNVAVQEVAGRIRALEGRIAQQDALIAVLEKRLAALEKRALLDKKGP
jgi:hypothetical protein